MGLLTDPSAGQGKITKALVKYHEKLCFLLYIGGIVWFCLLAYSPMNAATYFSENALLPGLVRSEFRDDKIANQFYRELLDEQEKYPDSIPYPWLIAKFRQLGLDTYTHNFILNYPLGTPQKFTGKNIYGILRAARASSTESLVLSVPYRPPVSVHETTAPSIAIMLAFAKFANKEKYWAKDIIFLITEHEQLGIQAWLQAYHGVACGNDGVLEYGDLKGRAGAIQAALNLELHDINVAQIDVKIEGLNGQLPNLDLFNLATKMCFKENVYHTFKGRPSRNWRDPLKEWSYSFKTLMKMVLTQATGIPNGNHGLYHRFGIEALTIEGFSSAKVGGGSKVGLLSIGRLIEGIFRSLNNLLERFHQSFFFYLLPSSDRFVSIGLYMPAICLIAGTLYVKACAMWFELQQKNDKANEENDEEKTIKPQTKTQLNKVDEKDKYFINKMFYKYTREIATDNRTQSFDLVTILFVFLLAHAFGILIMFSPQFLASLSSQYGYATDKFLFISFLIISIVILITPELIPFRSHEKSMTVFNLLTLLELGTALIGLSMTNFSLALLCSVVYVPLALIINVKTRRFHGILQKILWLLVQPLLVIVVVVLVYTYIMFPGELMKTNLIRSLTATQQAIIFSIVDSIIYGNWLFNVLTSIFIPNWICFWFVAFSQVKQEKEISQEKKTN